MNWISKDGENFSTVMLGPGLKKSRHFIDYEALRNLVSF